MHDGFSIHQRNTIYETKWKDIRKKKHLILDSLNALPPGGIQ